MYVEESIIYDHATEHGGNPRLVNSMAPIRPVTQCVMTAKSRDGGTRVVPEKSRRPAETAKLLRGMERPEGLEPPTY